MPPSASVFLSRLISLFFGLFVGSVLISLYVPLPYLQAASELCCCTQHYPWLLGLLLYQLLWWTLEWSFLSLARAWASSLVMFLLGMCACLKAPLISALSSSVIMWLQVQTCLFHSNDVLPIGGLLGAIVKLGPWASRETWASVRGTSDRFFTHLFDCAAVVVVVVSADAGDVIGEVSEVGEVKAWHIEAVICAIHVWCCWYFEGGHWCLNSHPLLVGTIIQILLDASLRWSFACVPSPCVWIHSILYNNQHYMTFKFLHACISSKCTYFYGIVYGPYAFICQLFFYPVRILFPLGVLILLLNFRLVGVIFWLLHLRVNLLWFLKLTIFLSCFPILSIWWHFCSNLSSN